MKRRPVIILVVLACLLAAPAGAAERPHWSMSFNGGYFIPDIDGWKARYGDDGTWFGGLELGWKILRQLELSAVVQYSTAEGTAVTPTGRTSADTVTFRQMPVHLSLLYRFVFGEDQIVVPYLGGGYTHVYYWEKLNNETATGDRFGYHARAGFQILLDPIEPEAAEDLAQVWGVTNTYLYFEGLYSKVDDFGKEDLDIGGWGITTGFLFEF